MPPPETQSPPTVGAVEGPKTQSGDDQLGDKNTPKPRTPDDYRHARFALHSQIRRLLIGRAAETAPGKHAGNVYRTAACTWVRTGDVSVVRPAGRDSFHYKGLVTCGSVWVCPLCAAKIQERRRLEVAMAIAYASSIERAPFMASFTFPHRVDQPLAQLLKLQAQALTKMRQRRDYMALMLKVGTAGRIRSLEVTHGANGWHPHTHELLFCVPEIPAAYLRDELSRMWLKACRSVGLFVEGRDREGDFLRHSVDVQAGDQGVAAYLAKLDDQSAWGLSHELTKASSKQGRRSGQHPFALASSTATRYLFLEYVEAMKGQRQLVWSRGLKAAVGVAELTDEEVAQQETEKADAVISIPLPAWRVILGNDARCEILHAARIGGEPEIFKLLRLLGYDHPKEADS
jgi:hypothetical protein